MNTSVVLFFVFNILATVVLGGKFLSQRSDKVFKIFGVAMLLNALAFAIWTYGLVKPENLLSSVTLGTIVFLVSLVAMFYLSIQRAQSGATKSVLAIVGIFAALGIFYFGHLSPSLAYISPEGFLFFNLGSLMQMLYIFALALVALPAAEIISSKLRAPYSEIFRYGFIAEVCGGIILMTSKDANVLYVAGWVIGLVYILLLTTFVFNKRAWQL